MSKKRMIGIVIALVAAFFVLTGFVWGAPAAKNKFKIGFATQSYTFLYMKHYTDELVGYAKTKGLDVIVADANSDADKMNSQVSDLLSQKIDFLIIATVDTNANIPAFKEANQAGVPVMAVLDDVPRTGIETYFVGQKASQSGELQAEWLAGKLPKNPKICYVMGPLGIKTSIDRHEAFMAKIKSLRPDVTILADQTGNWMRDKTMALTEDWIQRFPQIDAIACASDEMALGAVQALKSANRQGVFVLGVDALPEGDQSILDGGMSMSAFLDGVRQSHTAIDVALKVLNGQHVPKDTILPFIAVDRTNAAKILNSWTSATID